MKLAFCLFKFFPYGGVQRDCLRVMQACALHGHEVDVYTLAWESERPEGIRVIILPARGVTNHTKALNFSHDLQKKLSEQSYDSVIGFNKMSGLDVCFVGDVCFKKNLYEEKPFWCRFLPRYRTYLKLEEAVFSPKAKTHVLLITPRQFDEYQAYYQTPKARLHLVPPGLTRNIHSPEENRRIRERIRETFGLQDKTTALLFAASHFETKGLDRVIKALNDLNDLNELGFKLFVAGGDDKGQYETLAKVLGVKQKIVFLGARNDLRDVMKGMDILVHPARVEAAGMVLLEAMIEGLPSLTLDVCGYAFHIENASAGHVLKGPFDQASFNKALRDMISDGALRDSYHKQARQYAKTIDFYSMGEKSASLIEKLSNKS